MYIGGEDEIILFGSHQKWSRMNICWWVWIMCITSCRMRRHDLIKFFYRFSLVFLHTHTHINLKLKCHSILATLHNFLFQLSLSLIQRSVHILNHHSSFFACTVSLCLTFFFSIHCPALRGFFHGGLKIIELIEIDMKFLI